jgi:hypothetical protein
MSVDAVHAAKRTFQQLGDASGSASALDADGAAEHVAHEAALAALRVSLQNAGARRAQQSTRATTSASLRAIKRALTYELKALRGERVHAVALWAATLVGAPLLAIAGGIAAASISGVAP